MKYRSRYTSGIKHLPLFHVFWRHSTVHTAYSVIGFSVKSGIMSILGWYRFPYSNNYWKVSKIGYSADGFGLATAISYDFVHVIGNPRPLAILHKSLQSSRLCVVTWETLYVLKHWGLAINSNINTSDIVSITYSVSFLVVPPRTL